MSAGGSRASLAVRVVPRSGRRGIEVDAAGIVVRVRAAPERGKATEEARRTLAGALGVPPTAVSLRTGATARRKVFRVEGLTESQAWARLRG